MKYVLSLIPFIIGIGSLAFGFFGLHLYFAGDEKQLSKIEILKSEGQTTSAVLDTMVLEMKVKGITIYSLGYNFEVNGSPYKGTYSFNNYDDLDSLTGEVTYLPSDPEISSININAELAEAKKRLAQNESSSLGLWVGIGFILFGLFNLYRTYRRITKIESPRATQPPPTFRNTSQFPPDSDFV